MKLKYLILNILVLSITFFSNAQCVSGSINSSIWGTPDDFAFGFTSDADITDIDTVQVVQGVDTIIYIDYLLPKKQHITTPITGDATVTSVQILGVTGLPTGMNWILDAAANGANNTYYPQTYRYGTVTLCGTTFSTPGVKTLTVTVDGCGSLSGISDCAPASFPLYIEVLPGQGGNSAFTFTPTVGCNSLDVDFEAIFQSPDPVLYPIDFNWDLGDGTTATGTTISAHNYSTPGVYPVKLEVVINEFYISGASVVCSGGWYPDIEELTALQSPEPYLIINGTQTSSGSGASYSWTGLDIPLSSTTINGQTKEEDTGGLFGSADDDLGSGSTTIIPSDGGTYAITTTNSIISVTVNKRVSSVIEFWDTIKVFSNSVATITSSNGTVFCGGDSTILDLGSSSFDFIQWYNDTTLLLGENSQTLNVSTSGNYFAEILNSGNICSGNSNMIAITTDDVLMSAITQTSSGLEIDNPDGYDVQWFSNGVPIPGATSDVLTDLSSGNPFTVSFTNANGCMATSIAFNAVILNAGTSTQSGSLLSSTDDITFSATGFDLCVGQEIAWAVSTEADGAITNMSGLQTSIDAGWVYPSTSLDEFDVTCGNTTFPPGDYYMTPFSADALVIEPVYWNPFVDSANCEASMTVCITLTGTDYEINPLEIVLPNGTVIDVLDQLAGLGGLGITPQLWASALTQQPTFAGSDTMLCLDLIDLLNYYDNPNGDWTFRVPNVGTGDVEFSYSAFNIVVSSATCDSISTDQIIPVSGMSQTIAGGDANAEITIQIPPIPSTFPEITLNCLIFGDATQFSSTCVNAIEDLLDVNNINLYPNPNNGMFTLAFDMIQNSDVEISIIDITGRKILNRTYNNVSNKFNESFDLKNNLNTGFYFMEIKVGDFSTQKKFIVK